MSKFNFKYWVLTFILLYPFLSFSQTNYTIKGFGKGFKEGDKIFLLYREPGMNISIADSTLVKNGAFEFKGNVKNITTGGIYRNTNPVYANTIADSFSFYIEPGNIVMKSADTLQNMEVFGTQLNNDYMKLVRALKPLTDKVRKLKYVEELTEEEQKDEALVSSLTNERQKLSDQILPIQLNFIRENPDSYVSLVTLSSLSRNPKLLSTVEEIFVLLSSELKEKLLGKEILRRIEFAKKINIGMIAKEFSKQT